jgi:hypothetical protein
MLQNLYNEQLNIWREECDAHLNYILKLNSLWICRQPKQFPCMDTDNFSKTHCTAKFSLCQTRPSTSVPVNIKANFSNYDQQIFMPLPKHPNYENARENAKKHTTEDEISCRLLKLLTKEFPYITQQEVQNLLSINEEKYIALIKYTVRKHLRLNSQPKERKIKPYANSFCNICLLFYCPAHYFTIKNNKGYIKQSLILPPDNDKACIDPSCLIFDKIKCKQCLTQTKDTGVGLDDNEIYMLKNLVLLKVKSSCFYNTLLQINKCGFISNWLNQIVICRGDVKPKVVYSKGIKSNKVKNDSFYIPCSHYGPCTNCYCIKRLGYCQKYCLCKDTCEYQYPGCKCMDSCDTKSCLCFNKKRECDPELCSCSHGVPMKILINRLHYPHLPCCNNLQFTIGRKRKLIIGKSLLCDGYGLFANELFNKGEYIGEYIGELTSDPAANERDKIYDKVEVTYMFILNSFFALDSWEFGNKLRYANHSKINSNCIADIIYACGQYKVVLKATACIQRFEEILFDYQLIKKYKWLLDFNEKPKKLTT